MSAVSAHGSHSNHQLVGVQGLEYGVSQEGLVLVEAHRREERDQLQRAHQHRRSLVVPAIRQHPLERIIVCIHTYIQPFYIATNIEDI